MGPRFRGGTSLTSSCGLWSVRRSGCRHDGFVRRTFRKAPSYRQKTPTSAKAGAHLGDGDNDADRFVSATFQPEPRPSPGWRLLAMALLRWGLSRAFRADLDQPTPLQLQYGHELPAR